MMTDFKNQGNVYSFHKKSTLFLSEKTSRYANDPESEFDEQVSPNPIPQRVSDEKYQGLSRDQFMSPLKMINEEEEVIRQSNSDNIN